MVRIGADLTDFSPAMETASTQVGAFGDAAGTAGDAWGQAAGKITDAVPGIKDLGQESETASQSVGDLVKGLLELGEALAITEGLKEFAGDALSIYANVEKASISLTALTGSAGTASQMIEGLKSLALEDALSFPALVGAAQKMTALGFSTSDTNTILQTAGNTAAATGGDIGGIANAIDRMVLSGTAGARQLATLGISAGTLGEAMNVAAGDVAATFKALDQEDRITAINTALGKFSGVAQEVATSVAGQWQNLKTQWEFVMEGIGQALAPVAKSLISFLSIDVVPFIQGIVDAFQNLSPGMQQFVVIGTALVPVVAAAALGLAGMGAAFTALAGVGEILVPVIGVVGLLALAVAEIHFDGTETAAVSLYHAIADNFPSLSGILGTISTALGLVGQKAVDWVKGITDQTPLVAAGLQGVQDDLDRIAPSIARTSISDWLQAAVNPAKMLKLAMGELADVIQYLGGNYQSMAQSVTFQLGLLNTANDQFNHAMAVQAGAFNSTSIQLSQIAKDYATLKQNLADAQTKLGEVKQAYDDGTASLGQYADAQKAVEKAQLALNPNFVTHKQALSDLNTATKDLNTSQGILEALLNAIAPPVISLTSAQNNLKQAQQNAVDSAGALATAQSNLNAAIALGPGHANDLKTAEDALKTAETNAKDAKTGLQQATKDVTTAQTDATTGTKEAQTAASDYATYLQTTAKGALTGYATDLGAVTAAQKIYDAAIANQHDLLEQLNVLTLAGLQNSSDYKTVQLALAAAHQEVATDLKALNSDTTDYNTTSKTLASAQKDIISSQQQLDTIYAATSIPNVKDLVGQLQNLRDAKTQVAGDTNAEQQAEANLQDTIDDYLMGNATLAQVTQAQKDLDVAKVQTTDDNKTLTTTETNLTTAFGITKQAMQDIVNPQNTMTTGTQNANAAFSALGIQSASSLQTLADKATTAFNTITAAGTASPQQINDAQIKMLQAVQAAYVAAGTNLSTTQQNTLTGLLNQQTDFNNSMINHWHNLYVTIEGDVSSLSDTLITDLFTGKHSFGQDAIAELEKIASAFVSTLIKPITDAIGQFIAGALTNLLNGIKGIGTSMSSVASGPGFSSFLGLFNSGGVGGAPAGSLNGVNALSGTDLSAAGEGIAGAGSGMASAAGAITTSVMGAVGAIGSAVGAITGIIGDIETGRSNNILYSIEQNTTATSILMGQQIQLMWRLAADLEFGETEKNSFIIVSLLTSLNDWGLKDLDNISGNSNIMASLLRQGSSTSTTSGGTMGGTEEYLPGTPAIPGTPYTATEPIAFPNIEDALNNYAKVLQEYVDGAATGPQVQLAQQQVNLSQQLYDKQQEYNTALQKYLANPSGPGLSAQLAFAASQLQAAGVMQVTKTTAGTPAGADQLVTTIGELVTANTALSNINTTLQFNVGLSPWFQGAFQNINDGIVACAGWLQGIAGILGVVNNELANIPNLPAAPGATPLPGATAPAPPAGGQAPPQNQIAQQVEKLAAIFGPGYYSGKDHQPMGTVALNMPPSFSNLTPALAGGGSSLSAHAVSANTLAPITINIPNAKITNQREATAILDSAVNELRRRNRIL
jgi:hypothetical protein